VRVTRRLSLGNPVRRAQEHLGAQRRLLAGGKARRNLGIHDGGEELGHTEAVEWSRRRFSPCILMLLEERTLELWVVASCDLGTTLAPWLSLGACGPFLASAIFRERLINDMILQAELKSLT
jgi:hypothetical protein